MLTTGDSVEGEEVYARVANIQYPPEMRAEVVRVARGLTPVLSKQRGFNGLQLLTGPNVGQGVIITLWETEEAAKASEASSSYIGQMSMMSSFLYGRLIPKTYELDIMA